MKVVTKDIKVLIVDDQETFRSAARLVVELTDGFQVVGEAETGEEAVDVIGDLTPDLVLMDMNLPGIDGPEATKRIKGLNPSINVVGLSTYEEYADRALRAGAAAFVSKEDFEPGKLREVWSRIDRADSNPSR